MAYSNRKVMKRAWELYRKNGEISFAEALHRSWIVEKASEINFRRINAAKEKAGIIEEVNTWKRWYDLGYEVIHGSKALFGTELIWGSKGDGAIYKASFFGASQVQARI